MRLLLPLLLGNDSSPLDLQKGVPLAGRGCCFPRCWATTPAHRIFKRRAPCGMRLLLPSLLVNDSSPPDLQKARPSRDAAVASLVAGQRLQPPDLQKARPSQDAGRAQAYFAGYMGKRKAVDPLDPISDRKKLKKRSLKLVTKIKESTHKPFEEIDQLFEEVEAILNCTVGINGAPPPKNASAHPGRIQDFFKKRMKDQVPNPVLVNSRVVSPITHNNTPFPFNGLTTTASDPLSRHGSHQVEEEGSTPTPVIPLSPRGKSDSKYSLQEPVRGPSCGG
ncbi:hypothetical protein NDU88_002896 [Pleurodeles waltl]|uniref:Uncharacterized protein n=1 Tax=Pleurodeles waltl TaxID=8319 RepID=A0AAV7MRW3_PLEWA|nr:hypothetical protein NDU88_002896 [Pleurodeles waltl]